MSKESSRLFHHKIKLHLLYNILTMFKMMMFLNLFKFKVLEKLIQGNRRLNNNHLNLLFSNLQK